MQINFTGHNMEVTHALRVFSEEKIDKLQKIYDNINKIDVVFNVEKNRHIVEATVHAAKIEIHAHAEAEDMYVAVDDLVHKLTKQLVKHKDKMLDHRDHRGHFE